MVTGSLPYLGEANIKDPLYQFIKTKQPESFWQQWTQYFRSQKEDQEEKDITFSTTDDEEIILDDDDLDSNDKTIMFQIWIQLLLQISSFF